MISTTRRWLRRNRANFAIGIGVLGVGYVASQYVLSKITEARERMSNDRIAKDNLRRRFQQNQEDCTFTVLALLPTATENILEASPVESITHELQQKKAERLSKSKGSSEIAPSQQSSGPPSVTDDDGRSLASFQSESYVHASQMEGSSMGNGEAGAERPRKSKAQLWNELKINSITRSFALIYTLCLLTLLTRVQLNLLGRRNYLSSVVSLASHPTHESTISLENHDDDSVEQSYGNDLETNRRFLTFSWWLLHRGWREIMKKVETAVNESFGPLNPREEITLEKLSDLTLEVRKKIEGATEEERRTSKWLLYILPPREEEDFVLRESGMATSPPPTEQPSPPLTNATPTSPSPTPLRRLLDETSDLIDSPPFTHVLTKLLDACFSVLVDQKLATQAFKITPSPTAEPTPRIQEILSGSDTNGTKTKVANVLAVMTRQAHSIGNGVPNEYLQAMEGVRDLEGFAAIVYSSNFEFEAPSSGGGSSSAVTEGGSRKDSGRGEEVKTGETESEEVKSGEIVGGEGSLVGTESGFESVWGKVTEGEGKAGDGAMTG
ncbi:MAG: peroxin [Pleopsidium flavum]|nr:MAG: peroxin [Pleopsidium flavum]